MQAPHTNGDPARPAAFSWLSLAGPLAVLALEVAALTPFVEFADGPMAYVANGRLCAALLFALVAFLLLSARRLQRPQAAAPRRRLAWLAVNLGLYLAFFVLTLWLAGAAPRAGSSWLAGAFWALLGVGVGFTAFVTFVPLQTLSGWARRSGTQAAAAAGLGLGFALLTPWVQGLWPRLHGPAIALDRVLLQWTYGEALVGTTRQGFPVLGNRQFLVQVTPQCSELEAIAALWMLAGAVVLSRWRELHKARVAVALLAATVVLYLLIAARLYGLVVAGIRFSPDVCVGLAHSRLGGILLLGVTAALIVGFGGWCRRGEVSGGS
jgi:exosortase/archaeosortase family protein